MDKYELNFWFEHGGHCIWIVNEKARDKYGCGVNNGNLPISSELITLLYELEDEFHSYLDWDYPPNPSPWSEEHKIDFKKRTTEAYNRLCVELGDEYSVKNKIGSL